MLKVATPIRPEITSMMRVSFFCTVSSLTPPLSSWNDSSWRGLQWDGCPPGGAANWRAVDAPTPIETLVHARRSAAVRDFRMAGGVKSGTDAPGKPRESQSGTGDAAAASAARTAIDTILQSSTVE